MWKIISKWKHSMYTDIYVIIYLKAIAFKNIFKVIIISPY